MTVHRLTASKEVLSVLNKVGHTFSYDDVRLQNDDWLTSLSSPNEMFNGLKKGIVTHSSIDNNDGRQETNTGHHTTPIHHYFSQFCQVMRVVSFHLEIPSSMLITKMTNFRMFLCTRLENLSHLHYLQISKILQHTIFSINVLQ